MARNRRRRRDTDKLPLLPALLLTVLTVGAVYFGLRAINAPKPTNLPQVDVMRSADLLHPTTNPTLDSKTVEYNGFTANFNATTHIPNWVSWELTADETNGTISRKSSRFAQDHDVPGCPSPNDYKGSGFDKGHLCPAADMKWSEESMHDCFYLTNICPQLRSLNGGVWKTLEEKCREWAKIDSALIIIAGPVLSPEPDEFIGDNQVAVPKAFFKVIAAPYANPPRGIAFLMPNGKLPAGQGFEQTATTIDNIEAITGHDFFPTLPDSLQALLESTAHYPRWTLRR